jgi:SAM-dependent methyltransferase
MNLRKYFVVAAILLGSIFCYKYFFKSWSPYYQEKLYKNPRPLLIQALQSFNEYSGKERKALDLGAGAGNDTAFLLKNGWHVWANDKEPQAIQIMSTRTDIEPYKNNITFIQARFSDVPWDTLPLFDLVYAGYALPFVDKDSFYGLWRNIFNALKPQAIFAAHFFGSGHEGFNAWEKRSMNFFTKAEIVHLLQGFEIIILEESTDINEHGIMDHSFSVIARKS